MITKLSQIAEKVRQKGKRHRIAVAWAQDPNTISSIAKAIEMGFAEAIMIGDSERISDVATKENIDPSLFKIIHTTDEKIASSIAVSMAASGEADIVMKGLVGTDTFLKAVMNKEHGIMIPGATLSYVCAIEIPEYKKLLFLTDPAVIPFPDFNQKISMAKYALEMANRFGVEKPRLALIGASEKVSPHFENSIHYSKIKDLAAEGKFGDCIVDGPLDLFLACDPGAAKIKGVNTPVNGEADILLFPSLEASNPFYKGLMLFAKGELAGLIRGTSRPVVVMSRSETELSKFYCVALACLMA